MSIHVNIIEGIKFNHTIINAIINVYLIPIREAVRHSYDIHRGTGPVKLTGNCFLNRMRFIIFIVIISSVRGHHE